MITILITILICSAYFIYQIFQDTYSDIEDYLMAVLAGVAFGLFIGAPLAFMLPMKTYQKQTSLSIQTLQDNNSVKGNFFLGCGQVNGTMKYVCYYEENGYYQMLQIDYDKAKIKYCDSIPKITILEIKATKDKINLFAIDLDLGEKTYIIEVPKGTIKNNYNLDAQ